MSPRLWTPERLARLRRLLRDHEATWDDIGEALGCSGAAARRASRYWLCPPHRPTGARSLRVPLLPGETTTEAALRIGVSTRTVRRWRREGA